MIKKDITYESPFTPGQPVTETHYFHISKTDLVEMEIEESDAPPYIAKKDSPESGIKAGEELTGMRAKLTRIQESQDGKASLAEIKSIIRRAYGKREGDRHIKSQEISDAFASSEAFSQLLWDICTDPETMGEFFSGIFPPNLAQIAEEVQAQAARVTAGREAQEQAKAAASGGHPSDPAATPVEEPPVADGETERSREIANATPQNPVTLTQAEVVALDSDDLKSGLAAGRYKLSPDA